ncbi:MAG: hypothetical protein FI729_01085 [SAR202 cluster bacterium]|nr:hypothetical protein [SAR202 cluster bacterium]
MKFFRCAAYVLFAISLCNLGFSAYMYRELRTPNVIVAPDPALREINEHSMIRDTQILQGILMIHHDREIHPAGKQDMCPLCDEHNRSKNMMVQQ